MRLTVIGLAVVASLHVTAAMAGCKLARVTTLPLTMHGDYPIVEVAINEHPGQFVVDTGSAQTTLDPDYAKATGVGMDKRAGQYELVGAGGKSSLPIWTAHARRIQVGDIPFEDWEFPVTDRGLPSTFHVDGLLGADFLHYFDIELDMPAGKLSVWRLFDCTDIHPMWSGDYDAIELKPTKNHMLSMPIGLDNAIMDIMLDTGAGGILLTRDAARQAGVTDADIARDSASQGQGIGGAFTFVAHRFKTFLVGSAEFDNLELSIDPATDVSSGADVYSSRAGLLGLGMLKADRVWISYTTNTLFLQNAAQAKKK